MAVPPQPPAPGMTQRSSAAECKRSFQLSPCNNSTKGRLPPPTLRTRPGHVRRDRGDKAYRCYSEHPEHCVSKTHKVAVASQYSIEWEVPEEIHAHNRKHRYDQYEQHPDIEDRGERRDGRIQNAFHALQGL